VFTKRDRTARLPGVANLLFHHPHGPTETQIAERIDMNERTDVPELHKSRRRTAGETADRYLSVRSL